MLFGEWCENERCVYFSSLITNRAWGMCEMNLWLKRLNKHIPPHWDGLAPMIISRGWGLHPCVSLCVCVCVHHLLFSSSVSFINNSPFMWIHFTTIHPTFMLIDTPPSKSGSFTGATGFYIKHTSRKPRWQEPYNNALHLEIRCSYSFVYTHGAPRETSWVEQRAGADTRGCKWKKDLLLSLFWRGERECDKRMQMRPFTLDQTCSEIWEVSACMQQYELKIIVGKERNTPFLRSRAYSGCTTQHFGEIYVIGLYCIGEITGG